MTASHIVNRRNDLRGNRDARGEAIEKRFRAHVAMGIERVPEARKIAVARQKVADAGGGRARLGDDAQHVFDAKCHAAMLAARQSGGETANDGAPLMLAPDDAIQRAVKLETLSSWSAQRTSACRRMSASSSLSDHALAQRVWIDSGVVATCVMQQAICRRSFPHPSQSAFWFPTPPFRPRPPSRVETGQQITASHRIGNGSVRRQKAILIREGDTAFDAPEETRRILELAVLENETASTVL